MASTPAPQYLASGRTVDEWRWYHQQETEAQWRPGGSAAGIGPPRKTFCLQREQGRGGRSNVWLVPSVRFELTLDGF
jgi:hypothetical protein